MGIQQINLFLVEDDANDVFFARRAIEKSPHLKSFHVLGDGVEAIKFFACEGEYADKQKWQRPNVVLLDLKMPRLNGFQVLEWLQRHPECKVIPTMVCSSSAFVSDVKKAYELGANAYFVKPATAHELMEILRSAAEFWARCEIPSINECR